MADALCGPSNALQNFQKHTTVDRTLQQDRLVGRHTPSQVGSRWRYWMSVFLTIYRASDRLLDSMQERWTMSSTPFKLVVRAHCRKSSTTRARNLHLRRPHNMLSQRRRLDGQLISSV